MKKLLFGFLFGLITGVGGYWYIERTQHQDPLEFAGEKISTGAKKAKESIEEKFSEISAEQIKDEIARSGVIVREKARSAGAAISDATVNARTTAAIKAKLIKEPNLSSLHINVDTTDGVVTLSGTAASPEEIAKAMRLSGETEGVNKVISTLQIKAAK